jgi:hypothetical protein
MNRDELDLKGAKAMMARFNPGGIPERWTTWADGAYRGRATVVIDAVEDDIRRDERERIVQAIRDQIAVRDMGTHHPLEMIARLIERRDI